MTAFESRVVKLMKSVLGEKSDAILSKWVSTFDVPVHTGSRISHRIYRLTLKILKDKNCVFELRTFEDMLYNMQVINPENMQVLIQRKSSTTFKTGNYLLFIEKKNSFICGRIWKRKISIVDRLCYQNHF